MIEVTKPVSRLRCGDKFLNGVRVFGVTQVGGRGTSVMVITAPVKREGIREVPDGALRYTEYAPDTLVIVLV